MISCGMKSYPKIAAKIEPRMHTFAFDKLDGSNIRAEWSKKKGFYKFGSRNRLLGTDQEFISEAEGIIRTNFERDLDDIFRNKRYERAMAFFEFYGERSFAGTHHPEPHDVALIDVAPYKKGITLPIEFLSLYGHLNVPRVLFQGKITEGFIDAVKDGSLDDMTFEGVVCKGADPKNGKLICMYKVKNREWINRLRDYCGGNQALFRRLV